MLTGISEIKKISLLILLLAAFDPLCGQSISSDMQGMIERLAWLEGRWVLSNHKPGQSGIEQWKKISPVEWRGIGATLNGKDSVFVERLKIVVRNNSIYYVAVVPGNQIPVSFGLTEISVNGFIFENSEHDFPKKITYQHNGEKLKATVSGNGKSIDYHFIKE